jgi:hypothetical protein
LIRSLTVAALSRSTPASRYVRPVVFTAIYASPEEV